MLGGICTMYIVCSQVNGVYDERSSPPPPVLGKQESLSLGWICELKKIDIKKEKKKLSVGKGLYHHTQYHYFHGHISVISWGGIIALSHSQLWTYCEPIFISVNMCVCVRSFNAAWTVHVHYKQLETFFVCGWFYFSTK